MEPSSVIPEKNASAFGPRFRFAAANSSASSRCPRSDVTNIPTATEAATSPTARAIRFATARMICDHRPGRTLEAWMHRSEGDEPLEPEDRTPDERPGPRSGPRSGPGSGPRSGQAWGILAAIAVALLIVFAALNFRPVRVHFILFESRARVVTVIIVAAALGFVVGYFVGRPSREDRRRLRDLRDRSEDRQD